MSDSQPDPGKSNDQLTEMTVREATVYSLECSQAEFENMKEEFQSISSKFESGADHDALLLVRDKVIPKITPLFEFCFTLTHVFDDVIEESVRLALEKKIVDIDRLMGKLAEETEKANFIEVGDMLRFDFTDLVTEISVLFPKIKQCFHDSKVERLDEY